MGPTWRKAGVPRTVAETVIGSEGQGKVEEAEDDVERAHQAHQAAVGQCRQAEGVHQRSQDVGPTAQPACTAQRRPRGSDGRWRGRTRGHTDVGPTTPPTALPSAITLSLNYP